MNKPSLSIVIPNWNGEVLLKKHLKTVLGVVGNAEMILVDDGSTDDSVAYVKKTFPEIRVIEKKKNEGFASTVNVGVKAAKGDIVFLLNTDVEPEKGFLEPLLKHFDDPTVFAVGCLEISHEEGKIVERGRGIAWWEKGFFVHKRGEVDQSTTAWVSGGSGAFRKSIWNTLGGMDELYNPFYWEDIDLSYRAVKSGYRLAFEAKSVVHHYHEQGKILTGFSQKKVQTIALRNQFLFIWKNITDWRLQMDHANWTGVRLLQHMLRGNFSFVGGYLAARATFWPKGFIHSLRQRKYYTRTDRETLTLLS